MDPWIHGTRFAEHDRLIEQHFVPDALATTNLSCNSVVPAKPSETLMEGFYLRISVDQSSHLFRTGICRIKGISRPRMFSLLSRSAFLSLEGAHPIRADRSTVPCTTSLAICPQRQRRRPGSDFRGSHSDLRFHGL